MFSCHCYVKVAISGRELCREHTWIWRHWGRDSWMTKNAIFKFIRQLQVTFPSLSFLDCFCSVNIWLPSEQSEPCPLWSKAGIWSCWSWHLGSSTALDKACTNLHKSRLGKRKAQKGQQICSIHHLSYCPCTTLAILSTEQQVQWIWKSTMRTGNPLLIKYLWCNSLMRVKMGESNCMIL